MPRTEVLIAPPNKIEELGATWQRCSGADAEMHDRMLKERKHCMRCGEATEVSIRPGDRLTLYMTNDGNLVRIDVGGVTYFLDYAEVERRTVKRF